MVVQPYAVALSYVEQSGACDPQRCDCASPTTAGEPLCLLCRQRGNVGFPLAHVGPCGPMGGVPKIGAPPVYPQMNQNPLQGSPPKTCPNLRMLAPRPRFYRTMWALRRSGALRRSSSRRQGPDLVKYASQHLSCKHLLNNSRVIPECFYQQM